MSWSTILKAVAGLIALLREIFSQKRSREDRQAGRDSANADTLQKNQDAVNDANLAEIEADQRHKTMPGDEAFDQDFRRED